MQNILVIDDEAPICELLRTFLSRRDYAVTTAGCLHEAEECLNQNSFAAVILDILLPDGLGLDFLDQLRLRYPSVPVVIMTGIGYDEELLHEASQRGAAGFISKLLPLDQLLMEIHRVLRFQKTN